MVTIFTLSSGNTAFAEVYAITFGSLPRAVNIYEEYGIPWYDTGDLNWDSEVVYWSSDGVTFSAPIEWDMSECDIQILEPDYYDDDLQEYVFLGNPWENGPIAFTIVYPESLDWKEFKKQLLFFKVSDSLIPALDIIPVGVGSSVLDAWFSVYYYHGYMGLQEDNSYLITDQLSPYSRDNELMPQFVPYNEAGFLDSQENFLKYSISSDLKTLKVYPAVTVEPGGGSGLKIVIKDTNGEFESIEMTKAEGGNNIYETTQHFDKGTMFYFRKGGEGYTYSYNPYLYGPEDVTFLITESNCTDIQLCADGVGWFEMDQSGEFKVTVDNGKLSVNRVSGNNVVGDVNGDDVCNAADITALYNWILNNDDTALVNGDQNDDNVINAADVTFVYNIILGIGNGDEPPEDPNITTYTVNGVSFKMINVEGGTFTREFWNGGQQYQQVTLSNFTIGQTEVTQELWQAVMGSNPSFFNGGDYGTNLQRPVEMVNWDDCDEFITKLNQMTGMQFRLPTDAQWEFAALGGNKSHGYPYAGSDNPDDVAWYWGNAQGCTHQVATKQPNELGIYDMSGNVAEWCNDWYYYLSTDPQTDPTGPSEGSYRMFHGGNWNGYRGMDPVLSAVTSRGYATPSIRDNCHGLRLAIW